MTVWRWLGSLVCLLGLLVLVSSNLSVNAQDKDKKEEKDKKTETKDKADTKDKKDDAKDKKEEAKDKKEEPKDKKEEKKDGKAETGKAGSEKLTWKAFEGKTPFYQELVTKTNQNMKVMAQEIIQNQEQTFYLKWTPEEKTKDGDFVVTQEIVGVKMDIDIGGNKISYKSMDDKQPQNPMSDFFKALLNMRLKLTISPKMEVKNIEGHTEFVDKLSKTNPQMEPLLKALLSKEALQQMIEPTWGAIPADAVDKGSTWSNEKNPSVLNLGPIGKYTTTFSYTYAGKDDKQKGLDRIDIKASLKYTKPDQKNGLPFTIKEANLASKDGTGYALFDREKGRIVESNLKMKLSGDLTIEVGGMDTKVALEQNQDSTMRTMEEAPEFLKGKTK